jgi:hypothetical protein
MVMYDNVYKSDPFVGVAYNGSTDISVAPERRVGNLISDSVHLIQRIVGDY